MKGKRVIFLLLNFLIKIRTVIYLNLNAVLFLQFRILILFTVFLLFTNWYAHCVSIRMCSMSIYTDVKLFGARVFFDDFMIKSHCKIHIFHFISFTVFFSLHIFKHQTIKHIWYACIHYFFLLCVVFFSFSFFVKQKEILSSISVALLYCKWQMRNIFTLTFSQFAWNYV